MKQRQPVKQGKAQHTVHRLIHQLSPLKTHRIQIPAQVNPQIVERLPSESKYNFIYFDLETTGFGKFIFEPQYMKIACWIVVISYSNLSAQLLLVRLEVLKFFVKITFGIKI